MTSSSVAERAGISRGLMTRIEQGDPGCSIGVVFEVAALCGVPLFEEDPRVLRMLTRAQQEKIKLIPQSVRAVSDKELSNDF